MNILKPFIAIINHFVLLKITFHFKSGAKHVEYCKHIKTTQESNNSLSGYTMTGMVGSTSHYIRLDDVSFITSRNVFRWFK